VILATVIAVRIAWVMSYNTAVRLKNHWFGVHVARSSMAPPTARGGLAVAWCGMRGMVTLAAALALPEGFPYRDFILLAAFAVVLGTLVVQGLTLKPLLRILRLPDDDPVRKELKLARAKALKAALAELDGDRSEAADALRRELGEALDQTRKGADARDSAENALRRRVVAVSREAIADLRRRGEIGDDAYRALEEEFDWLELAARE
jgi:CPA1 family monovalent cation:H+ antiporter